MDSIEHPDIARIERYGDLGEPNVCEFICPICGQELEDTALVYEDYGREVVGCENCVTWMNASQILKAEEEI